MAVLFSSLTSRLTRSGPLDLTQDFTIVGWVRNVGEDPNPSTYRAYYVYGDPDYVSSAFVLYSGTGDDRAIYLDVWNGATHNISDPSYAQPLDTWIAVAFTYDALLTLLTLWVGGVPVGTVTEDLSALTFTITTERLGSDNTALWSDLGIGYWLEAQRLYTEAELIAQWASATAVSATNLLAFTPLPDPAHLQDDSGNGNDWTAAGPALTQLNILPIVPTLPFTTNYQFTAPDAGPSAVLTPAAVAWDNSPWVTLINATDADIVVTGIVVKTDSLANYVTAEFDLGVGTGPITAVTSFAGTWANTVVNSPGVLPHTIPLDGILAGQRVSARMRKNDTTTTAWGVKLQYYKKPIVGSLFTTTQPQLCYPSAAAPVTLASSASAWADSMRTELVPATDADWAITGLVPNYAFALSTDFEIDIDIGTAPETTLTTVCFTHNGIANVDGPMLIPFYRPLGPIPAGSRLSAVTRNSTGLPYFVIALKWVYHRLPL